MTPPAFLPMPPPPILPNGRTTAKAPPLLPAVDRWPLVGLADSPGASTASPFGGVASSAGSGKLETSENNQEFSPPLNLYWQQYMNLPMVLTPPPPVVLCLGGAVGGVPPSSSALSLAAAAAASPWSLLLVLKKNDDSKMLSSRMEPSFVKKKLQTLWFF